MLSKVSPNILLSARRRTVITRGKALFANFYHTFTQNPTTGKEGNQRVSKKKVALTGVLCDNIYIVSPSFDPKISFKTFIVRLSWRDLDTTEAFMHVIAAMLP